MAKLIADNDNFDSETGTEKIIGYGRTAGGALVAICVDTDGKIILSGNVDINFTGENLAQETGGALADIKAALEAAPSGGLSDPVNSKNATTQHTFHNAAITNADGTDFTNAGYKTLRVIIKSTVTPATRQVDFLGAIDGTFVAINGFKAPDYGTEDDGTTGTGTEIWIFDIEGYETIRMDLTTLTGDSANTSIIGVAT